MFNLQKLVPELEQLPASGLRIHVRRSKIFIGLYSLFYIFLALSFMLLEVAPIIKLPLFLVVTFYFIHCFRKYLLYQLPESVNSLIITELNDCHIQLNNGEIKKLSVLADTYVVEHLVILCLGKHRKILPKLQYSLIITAAMTGDELFRKLKCQLLFNFSAANDARK